MSFYTPALGSSFDDDKVIFLKILDQIGNKGATANLFPVTTQTSNVTLTPTVTANTYTAGYAVGGLLTFTNAVGALGSGILESVSVISKGSIQTAGLYLYLFDASPSSTITDRAAITWAAADYTNLIGVVPLSSTNTISGATMTLWYADSIAKAFAIGAGNTSLYGALVWQAASAALGSTSDIAINLTVLKDG